MSAQLVAREFSCAFSLSSTNSSEAKTVLPDDFWGQDIVSRAEKQTISAPSGDVDTNNRREVISYR
jgi:hypothetical protein